MKSVKRKSFLFVADPNDHCETPFDAYGDLLPHIRFLVSAMGGECRGRRGTKPANVGILLL